MSTISENQKVQSKIGLLKAWVAAQMAYSGQPAVSMGIVYDQEVVWAEGLGWADVEKQVAATADTKYRVASISKLFTATAVMQLRDAGKLQLDDPLRKHLPWFNIQNSYPDAPAITIRHLLTHTAGLPREANFPYWTNTDFPTTEQIQEALPEQATILPTETRWKYSNLAFSLAGEVVAAVSGQPYIAYVHTHILEPLGMADSSMAAPDPDDPQLAVGYGRRLPDGSRAISPYTDCRGITPAANLTTTVNDLAKFAMLQFRSGSATTSDVLRGSTLREMQRIHWLNEGWTHGWGIGFSIVRENGQTLVGHGGALQGYRTQLYLQPADKIAVIALTNGDDGNPVQYTQKGFEWVAPAVKKAAAPQKKPAEDIPDWSRYVGKYRSAWGDMQVLVQEEQLVAITPNLLDPLPALVTLVPVAEHMFRMEAQVENGYGSHGELLRFEMGENGRVSRVIAGVNYSYPVESW